MAEEQNTNHTIQKGSAVPLEQCTTCCSDFHCPFCASTMLKPTRGNKLNSHIKIHFKKAVVHGAISTECIMPATTGTPSATIERKLADLDVQVPLEQHDTEMGDKEPQIVKDLLTAVGWLQENCHAFRGFAQEPWYLTLNKEDQEKALLQLDQAEMNDDRQLAKEPFLFRFQFREDMEVFLNECHDKRRLRINSMFMEL